MRKRIGTSAAWVILILVGAIVLALGTFALPIRSWRTGESAHVEFPTSRSEADTPDRLWIDTDAACGNERTDPDDYLAIFALARANTIEIAGVSTVFGNAELEVTDRTARKLASRLAASENSLPDIVRGADSPFKANKSVPTEASAALSGALRKGSLTILALGPLTNIATTLRSNPSLAARVDRIIAVMGQHPGHLFHPSEGRGRGVLFGHGPVFSDLNFRKDPAAVRYVLSTKAPITLIPYEAARGVLLTSDDLDKIGGVGPAGAWIAENAAGWLDFWQGDVGIDGFYPFDLVAAYYVLSPDAYFCGSGTARVDTGWAPDWLWMLDSAGLFVMPPGRATKGNQVRYCPQLSLRLSVGEMLAGTRNPISE